jgi:hypothetical protein
MESGHGFLDSNPWPKGKPMLLPVTLVLTVALSVNAAALWGMFS